MIKEFMPACRSVLVLVLAPVLLLLASAEGLAKNSARTVVLLYTTNPWRMVIGSDSPAFALYDDGTAIFEKHEAQNREKPDFVDYRSTTLSDHEKTELLNRLASALDTAKSNYRITSATDMPTNFLWVRSGQKAKSVSVYGSLISGNEPMFGDTKELPPDLLSTFKSLMAFDREDAKPWMPEFIEVMISPFPGSQGKPIQWPADWPDLNDSRTVRRGDCYSVFVPSAHLEELRVIQNRMKETRAVQVNGKKWAISIRYPFPDETAAEGST